MIKLFNVKLSLIELTGVSYSTKDIVAMSDTPTKGFSFAEFSRLVTSVLEKHHRNLYDVLDKDRKGWITQQDFTNALDLVAPSYSKNFSKAIFVSADTKSLGVITKPHFDSL